MVPRYSDFRVTDSQLQRKRLAKQLASVDEMKKKQAREEGKRFLATINAPTLPPQNAVTSTAFVDSVYFPRIEQQTCPFTLHGYKTLWQQIKSFCAQLWIRDVRTHHVQSILDAMAKTSRFNVHSMQHIKSFLSGIFRVAIQQDFFDGSNPVREASIPKTRRAEETHAYSLEEVFAMMAAVPEPASTMLCAVAFTGVRRGELRGMQWQDYNDGELAISRSV